MKVLRAVVDPNVLISSRISEVDDYSITLSHDTVYILDMRFSDHFERDRRDRPDRREVTLEMCERVRAEPVEDELQENGRTAYWGYVEAKSRYFKVIVEADGEEITTARWDRGFKRKVRRRNKE